MLTLESVLAEKNIFLELEWAYIGVQNNLKHRENITILSLWIKEKCLSLCVFVGHGQGNLDKDKTKTGLNASEGQIFIFLNN